MNRLILLTMTVIATMAVRSHAAAEYFADGTRWMLIGDSITHDGRYAEWIKLYAATRYPDRDIVLLNGGISGDSAGGAVRRYAWDIAERKPNVATIMLGMNDVGRDKYQPGEPSPEVLKQREVSLENFRKSLSQLVGLLREENVRTTLLTPSPYDDTAELPTANLPGCNEGLARLAGIVGEVASEAGLAMIDVHTPMTRLNHEKQQADPRFTLIGNDRVHPGMNGHMVITTLLLRGMDAPAVVSDVAVDAARMSVLRCENAEVREVTRIEGGGIRFSVHAKSLPFPSSPETKGAMELTGFHDALNREQLSVPGLEPGSYRLRIGETEIGTYSAETLAEGVRLETVVKTPQNRQAGDVGRLVARWAELLRRKVRIIAMVEHGLLKDVPHPVWVESVKGMIEEKIAAEPDPSGYMAHVYRTYLAEKPREEETKAEVARLEHEIREKAQTRELTYSLVREL